MGPGRRRTTLALLLTGTVLGLGGCGTEAVKSGPSGVDGLQVPTPSPHPHDFVRHLSNPWLALETGTRWTFSSEDEPARTRVVTVTDEDEVDGVPVTVVHTQDTADDGTVLAEHDDLYAQDRAGNVWLFGREVQEGDLESWRVGEDGAEAGLAMPARPRRGDGFAIAEARGADEDRAEVVALDGVAEVPQGSYDDLLELRVSTPLDPGLLRTRSYARGVGLVLEEDSSGERWELVASTSS